MTDLNLLRKRISSGGLETVCDFAILFALPFVLIALDNTWIFPTSMVADRVFNTDRWTYSGFHIHMRTLLSTFPYTYYASRVPWNVLGWIAHRLLPLEAALYALHFFVFYVAIGSLYLAVKSFFGSRLAALGASILLATQSYFLATVGWDYVDGSSVAFILLSIAAFSAAATGKHWRLWLLLWGGSLAIVVSDYVLLVLFVPIEFAAFLLLNRIANRRPALHSLLLCLVGAGITVLGFACINAALGGPFWYFLAQIQALPAVAANRFRYDQPLFSWLSTAIWLLPLAPTAFFSAIALFRTWPSFVRNLSSEAGTEADLDSHLFVGSLLCLVAMLAFIGLQADHFYVLQEPYNASALLPFAGLAIGGALAAATSSVPATHRRIFISTSIVLLLAPWALARFGLISPMPQLFLGLRHEIAWTTVAALALALCLFRPRIAYVAVFAVFSAIGYLAYALLQYPHDYSKQPILAVYDASQAIAKYNPQAHARFWFDDGDPIYRALRAVVATYLYEYSLISEHFPSVIRYDGTREAFSVGDRVIILSSIGSPLSKADAALAKLHLALRQIGVEQIRRPGIAFTLTIGDVVLRQSLPRTITSLVPDKANVLVASAQGPEMQWTVHKTGWPISVALPPQPWAYGATLPIPGALRKPSGDVMMRISLRGVTGNPWIGILETDNQTYLGRKALWPGAREADFEFTSRELGRAATIIVQNGPEGQHAGVSLNSISILHFGS